MSTVPVDYRLIGEVNLAVDGDTHALAGRRQRELLALLLLETGTELSAERIAYELWGDAQPKTARNSVQRFVADLRAKLGPCAARLGTGSGGYVLAFDRSECDLFRVEDLITQARAAALAGQFSTAAALFRQSAKLQQGSPLAGLGEVDFAERARRRTEELWRTAAEERFGVELNLGHHVELLPELAAFTGSNPYRERGWEHYLVALYRCGRQQEALRAFAHVQGLLRDGLGVSPSPSLAAIEHQILDHAPALQPPAAASPGFLPDATQAEPMPVPQYLLRASEIPLVGRESEIAAITAVLEAAASGTSQTLVVRGEPGIGKTRLAAAAAGQAVGSGFTVAYGRSDENVSIPYQPWIEALTDVAASLPPQSLRSYHDHFGDALTPIVSNLAYLMAADGSPRIGEDAPHSHSPPEPGDGQMALFHAALGLIDAATARGPLVLVLDDLQWADASSLGLLQHVVQRAGGQLVMLLTYRAPGVEPDSPLVDLVGRLSPLPSVTEIDLRGLHVHDVAQVIENLGGPANDQPLAQAVQDQTSGNPFFATEVARQLIASGGVSSDSFDGGVPAVAHRIIQRRVAKLGDAAATTLQAAAAFGRDFELDLLSYVLGDDEFTVLAQLERGLGDGILIDSEHGYDRFQFTHDLVHQSLYNELSTSRRSRLHLAIADAIETLRHDHRTTRAGEVAGHLLATGDRRIARRTCLAARDAGQLAAAALAPGDAVQWFSRALEQLDLTDDDPRLRARILVQLGANQQYSRMQNHRETLLQAASVAAEVGDIATLTEACLTNTRGTFANVWNVDREAVALLKTAYEATDESEIASRASLLAVLANEEWDLEHATVIARHEESIRLARQSGQPAVLANALLRFARARGCYLSIAEHRAMNDEVAEIFNGQITVSPTTFLTLPSSKLQVALQSAEIDAVRQAFAGIHALPSQLALPYIENNIRMVEMIEIGLTGDAERYEANAAEYLDFNLEAGDAEAFLIYEAQLLYTRLMQGRTGELVGEIERIIAERPEAELYQSVAALLHVESGDIASGATRLEQAQRRGFIEGRNVFEVQSIGFWGETAAAVGNQTAAQTIFDMLVSFQGQFLGNMTQLTQPVDLTLGRLCTTLGRFDDAARFLASSARIADAFEARWMVARTASYQGVLARVQGASADAERFAKHALALACEGGYSAIERDARALLT